MLISIIISKVEVFAMLMDSETWWWKVSGMEIDSALIKNRLGRTSLFTLISISKFLNWKLSQNIIEKR